MNLQSFLILISDIPIQRTTLILQSMITKETFTALNFPFNFKEV